MEKIAVGALGKGVIDLDKSPTENLKALAKAKEQKVEDLTVVLLYRPRHELLIQEIRRAGARIRLISDGDVAAAIATTKPDAGIDIMMGIGGASQGVLAAAALRCLGGDMQARLKPRNQEEIERADAMGIKDIAKKYSIEELAGGEVMFAATGVTDGEYLKGVHFFAGGATTQSLVVRSKTRTVRIIHATHNFAFKPNL
jgi:fructose-1,6-bisphosphatase II